MWYLTIGYFVSMIFSTYYRLIKKSPAKQTDALAALIGILVWPLTILLAIRDTIIKRNEEK